MPPSAESSRATTCASTTITLCRAQGACDRGIKPGVVSIPHGFQASQFVEGHTQDLTNVYMNDFCSNSAFYDFLCEVEKYEGGVR